MNKDQLKENYLSSAINYRFLGKKQERLLIILSFLRFITFIGGLIFIWIGFTIAELKPGYRINGRLLRPASVKIVKNKQ